MTILDAPPRVTTWEELDLEFSMDEVPQCQMPWHLEGNDSQAEWKAVIHCRNKHTLLSCTHCKEENDSAWKKREHTLKYQPIVCTICHTPVPGTDPFHWEPL